MITKELLNVVRTGFDEAVAELGHKHNLRITLGGIRFGQQNATGKIEISLLDEAGTAQTTERTAWETHARSLPRSSLAFQLIASSLSTFRA